jgi:ribose transport system substrate-binding protein
MGSTRSAKVRPRAARGWGALAALLLLLTALVVAGCGSSGSSSSSSSGGNATSGGENESEGGSTEISVGGEGTVEDIESASKYCGNKKVTIGYVDSWASVNSWRKITKAELLDQASECPNIEKVITTDGQGDLQKTISNIESLVAQQVDGIVVLNADFGSDLVPAMRQAMQAGIPVVGLLGPGIEGQPGTDYVDLINANEQKDAKTRMEWLGNLLNHQGNVIDVGGTPGNPLSNAVFEGVQEYMAENPDMTLLTDHPIDTNFSPADEQKAIAGALAKYPKIEGVQNECGTCAPGGWRAFEEAGRPLVPWTSDDNNELACLYYELKPKNPDLEMLTTAARNWLSRVALNKTLAAAEEVGNEEPSTFTMPVVEDSTNPKMQPKCVKDAPPGAIWSSLLSDAQVIAAVE